MRRAEGSFLVYVGETGNERGHYVAEKSSLAAAKRAAARARQEYGGDGWSLIFDQWSGDRIISGRTA